jgi:hypothetical protein
MWMVDKKNMNAAQGSNPYIFGTFDRPARSNEDADASRIFQEQGAVAGAKFASNSAQRRDCNVLRPGRGT